MLLLDLRQRSPDCTCCCAVAGHTEHWSYSFGLQVKFDGGGDVLKLLFDCGQLPLTEL